MWFLFLYSSLVAVLYKNGAALQLIQYKWQYSKENEWASLLGAPYKINRRDLHLASWMSSGRSLINLAAKSRYFRWKRCKMELTQIPDFREGCCSSKFHIICSLYVLSCLELMQISRDFSLTKLQMLCLRYPIARKCIPKCSCALASHNDMIACVTLHGVLAKVPPRTNWDN